MAIEYVKIKKNIVVGATPGMKYMAKIFRGKAVDLDDIAEKIASNSTMSEGDIYGVLKELEKVLPWYLTEGHPVKLGMIGTFYPSIKVQAVDTLEKVTPETIKRTYCSFLPSKVMRDKMSATSKSLKDLTIKGLQPNN